MNRVLAVFFMIMFMIGTDTFLIFTTVADIATGVSCFN